MIVSFELSFFIMSSNASLLYQNDTEKHKKALIIIHNAPMSRVKALF